MVISAYISSAIVDPVFGSPHTHSNVEILFAIYGYAIQIYADFSGYTDIAIGIALLLGFRFPQNFDAPYTARSLQDFWRRWHMTLSRWLRDYLYIPLGREQGLGEPHCPQHHDHDDPGRSLARSGLDLRGLGRLPRRRPGGRAIRAATAGVASGSSRTRDRGRIVAERIATFHLVCLGWVFFRATSMSVAFTMIGRLFTAWGAAPLVTPLVVITIVGEHRQPVRVSRTSSGAYKGPSRAKLRWSRAQYLGRCSSVSPRSLPKACNLSSTSDFEDSDLRHLSRSLLERWPAGRRTAG